VVTGGSNSNGECGGADFSCWFKRWSRWDVSSRRFTVATWSTSENNKLLQPTDGVVIDSAQAIVNKESVVDLDDVVDVMETANTKQLSDVALLIDSPTDHVANKTSNDGVHDAWW
jgi:hypothetical protein